MVKSEKNFGGCVLTSGKGNDRIILGFAKIVLILEHV